MAAGSASEPRAGAHLERALELCYRRLGRRDHTTSELRRRLERDGIEVETIARALAVVAEQGYLDDARFALRFAEDRRAVDGWGEARIRARLESVGVERPLIDAALAGLGEEG
jgi:regulatory protein